MKFTTNLQLALAGSALLLAGTMSAQVAATSVASFIQGMRADGASPVSVVRSTVANATGFTTATHDVNIGEGSGSVEFVSLGFGGELILEFSTPICNGAGNDFKVWETSYGTPSKASWPEMALIEARQNDCQPWQTLKVITQDDELDLGVLPFAKYIRITDMTNPLLPVFFNSNQDGFDVDAVVGFNGCADPGAADQFSPNQVVSFTTPAFRKNGSVLAIGSSRHKPARMLGAPQMSDATVPEANVNFFALGFRSEVVLKFPYTLFDAPGADLNVYETTYGEKASRKCSNYPEKAEFYGSVDGTTWFPLSAIPTFDLIGGAPNDFSNVLCRDGQLDIGAGNAINYIKLVDVSDQASSFFPGSADAYDLDGIIGRCYSSSTPGKMIVENTNEEEIGEGVFGIELYPNPASDIVNLNVSAINIEDSYTVRIVDLMGRIVGTEVINSGKGSFIHTLNMSNLPAGIYAVSVETNGMMEVVKVVKK